MAIVGDQHMWPVGMAAGYGHWVGHALMIISGLVY